MRCAALLVLAAGSMLSVGCSAAGWESVGSSGGSHAPRNTGSDLALADTPRPAAVPVSAASRPAAPSVLPASVETQTPVISTASGTETLSGDFSQPIAPEDLPEPPPDQPVFTDAQLDDLLAPIALYPDALLAQVVAAAATPLDVVQAARWLRAGNDPAAAVEQPWSASVQALISFPEVLYALDEKLTWTTDLGKAYSAQPRAVMASVQRLRGKAYAAGNLKTSAEQTVAYQNDDIIIAPANTQVVYVPRYDPQIVYVDRVVYRDVVYTAPVISFSIGYSCWWWNDWRCDWSYRRWHCPTYWWGGRWYYGPRHVHHHHHHHHSYSHHDHRGRDRDYRGYDRDHRDHDSRDRGRDRGGDDDRNGRDRGGSDRDGRDGRNDIRPAPRDPRRPDSLANAPTSQPAPVAQSRPSARVQPQRNPNEGEGISRRLARTQQPAQAPSASQGRPITQPTAQSRPAPAPSRNEATAQIRPRPTQAATPTRGGEGLSNRMNRSGGDASTRSNPAQASPERSQPSRQQAASPPRQSQPQANRPSSSSRSEGSASRPSSQRPSGSASSSQRPSRGGEGISNRLNRGQNKKD